MNGDEAAKPIELVPKIQSARPTLEATEDGGEWSKELVAKMVRDGVHPVLIFGTGGSGKTTLLQSLISYAQSDDDARFAPSLGESVFPDGYPGKAERDENARSFFDNVIAAFRSHRLAPRTQLSQGPFFIPIDISVESETLRFAFLESMGEWYEREHDADPRRRATAPYQRMRWEIAAILRMFGRPISVIFVAPSIPIPGQSVEYSHECMANAMTQYDQLRRAAKKADNALLLATKWDGVHNPDDPKSGFGDATVARALATIETWVVWPRFHGIGGMRPGAKGLMPYAAAHINPDGSVVIGGMYADVFDAFNRTLWNWLYGNKREDVLTGARPVLYPDVVPPPPKRKWFEAGVRWLLRRGGPTDMGRRA